MRMRRLGLGVSMGLMAVVLLPAGVPAQSGVTVKRTGSPKAPFSTTVWAGDTLYVAGQLADPDVKADAAKGTGASWTADTKTQTTGTLKKIEGILKEQGLGMGDVVQMQVYLVGDSNKGGTMDFAGMNEAYGQFFGTAEQPNRPVRAAVQVAKLAAPGALVEIMVTAVRGTK